MRDWFGKFIHNCIAHPLLPFLPRKWGNAFHDWTINTFWPPQNKIKILGKAKTKTYGKPAAKPAKPLGQP